MIIPKICLVPMQSVETRQILGFFDLLEFPNHFYLFLAKKGGIDDHSITFPPILAYQTVFVRPYNPMRSVHLALSFRFCRACTEH